MCGCYTYDGTTKERESRFKVFVMIFSPLFPSYLKHMAAFKQLYMFGFGRFYMYVDACFGVVLLLLSVVLGTAWDYLSCLPFNLDSTKKKEKHKF